MSDKDDINSERLSYLLELLGKKKISTINSDYESDSDFEDIEKPNIYPLLNMMLATTPVITDEYPSVTTEAQIQVQLSINSIYRGLIQSSTNEVHTRPFCITDHNNYIMKSLTDPLPYYYKSLDANHGWLLFWLINSYSIINGRLKDAKIRDLVSDKICRNVIDEGSGGIAGGANQIGHAAATYASILALVLVEDYELLNKIRPNLYKWFLSLKMPNGSFIMHQNGESDTRSTYCVLVVASLLNILTTDLCEGTLQWLNLCQTFEGGFAGVPNTEAHGGYTFCGMASYFLLLNPMNGDFLQQINNQIDVHLLIRWCVMRQYQLEGGLSGRTNKLVDACYSFWIGAIYPMIELITNTKTIFDRDALKCYILNCCQNIETGGFKDKPGKSVDFYHTNYTICGLSITEHHFLFSPTEKAESDAFAYLIDHEKINEDDFHTNGINPVFSLPNGMAEECKRYFQRMDEHI